MKIHMSDEGLFEYLQKSYDRLFSTTPIPFSKLTPSVVSKTTGVYLTVERLGEANFCCSQ